MTKNKLTSQPPLSLPIPDLRFESTFRKALESATLAQSKDAHTKDFTPQPTLLIILRVILKDVVIMPLIQGFALSYLMLGLQPWLRYVMERGRQCGIKVMQGLMGLNTVRNKGKVY